jgi:hypothetical protein
VLVGVGAEPDAVEEERGARGLVVPLRLVRVLGLDEHGDEDVPERDLVEAAAERQRGARDFVGVARAPIGEAEGLLEDDGARVGGPGEIVDQRQLAGPVRRGLVGGRRGEEARLHAVALDPFGLGADARGPDVARVLRREIERDVVGAVVGEELGVRVELVAVPAVPALVHAELREPLRDEEEALLVAGAATQARDPRLPFHGDRQALAGAHGLLQRHAEYGAVVLVPVLGRAPREPAEELVPSDLDRGDALPAPFVVALREIERTPRFAEVRRAIVRERVPVEVEPQVGDVVAALVPPQDRLLPEERVRGRVDRGLDPVVGPAGALLLDLRGRGRRHEWGEEREEGSTARAPGHGGG